VRTFSESQDRLGSANLYPGYYPYGEEYIASLSDKDKFATYYRDGTTGLDYANNRYYSSTLGRFMTPDPYRGSAMLSNPQSWNRYSYAGNDPVNAHDPSGLDDTFSFPCVVGIGEGAEVVDCEVSVLSTGAVAFAGHVPHWVGTYNKALEKLSNGNDLLHKLFGSKNISQPCQRDLSAISDLPAMTFSTGESVPQVLINTSLIPSAVDETQWIDAMPLTIRTQQLRCSLMATQTSTYLGPPIRQLPTSSGTTRGRWP